MTTSRSLLVTIQAENRWKDWEPEGSVASRA
jgi:hypothetical protein